MKFKACFSEVGAGWLEKRFLPAFEKLSPTKGVELILLLTPTSVHLIHDAKAHGGPEIHADFVVSELFDETTYRTQSAHGNKIAFRFDAGMLRRVLAGLANSAPDGASIELKLTKKPVSGHAASPHAQPAPPATPDGGGGAGGPSSTSVGPQTAPFLEVSATGEGMVISHGVPLLGDPLRRSGVDACERLVASSGTGPPYWLTITPLLAQQLVAEVSSLKAVAPTIDLATLPCGDLHLYASTHALTLGTEHRGLHVAWTPGVAPYGHATPSAGVTPAAGSAAPRGPGGAPPTTPSSRLAAARARGPSAAPAEVHVACRDVLLALSFHVTRCDAMLLGVAAHGGYVEVACRYEDPGMAPDAVALGIKLPVKDDGGAQLPGGDVAAGGEDADAEDQD